YARPPHPPPPASRRHSAKRSRTHRLPAAPEPTDDPPRHAGRAFPDRRWSNTTSTPPCPSPPCPSPPAPSAAWPAPAATTPRREPAGPWKRRAKPHREKKSVESVV